MKVGSPYSSSTTLTLHSGKNALKWRSVSPSKGHRSHLQLYICSRSYQTLLYQTSTVSIVLYRLTYARRTEVDGRNIMLIRPSSIYEVIAADKAQDG